MRPRHKAAENDSASSASTSIDGEAASMRPRHKAAENAYRTRPDVLRVRADALQ